MATTVTAPVGNSITLAQKFLPLLDEIYARESLTNILDTANNRVQWTGANTVNLFQIDTVGLANYSRNAGYVPGDADGSWVPYVLTQDRGRSFMVDAMDNEETLGMMMGNLLGQFERTRVIPEIDAYRFAKWAGTANVDGTAANITSANAADAIQTAEAAMDDNEVPYEGRILYVSPTMYKALKGDIEKQVINPDTNIETNIEVFDGMRIIRVPAARFNTAVTMNAPTASDGVGGYTASGRPINFMIVHPSAIMQVMKHNPVRIFSPEQNQEADAYKVNYRAYHDTFVLKNKVKGIYVHHVPTT